MKKLFLNRKVVSLILCFLVSLTLSGCGQGTEVITIDTNNTNESNVIPNLIRDLGDPGSEVEMTGGDEILKQVQDDRSGVQDDRSGVQDDRSGVQDDSGDEQQTVEIPSKLDLPIPFVSQAPLRDWDPPYDEACEEASMMSVVGYLNKSRLNFGRINAELLALIDWEEQNGYRIDVDAQEVVQILKDYFNLSARLETEVTIDRIKYELAQGHPIIIPTSGRTLGNPYFRVPGPIYHMLVIRGYDNNEFITNDVGTNTKGEAFKYKYQTIIDSIHDWDHDMMVDGEMTDLEMAQGRKIMIVVNQN